MWKKIIVALLLIMILVAGYSMYLFALNNSDNDVKVNKELKKAKIEENIDDEKNKEQSESDEEMFDSTKRAYHVNCDGECEEYKSDAKIYHYCQNICGFIPIENHNNNIEDKDSCDNKAGLAKDYCLRDRAVENKDMELCKHIHDKGVREHCEHRIIEDIVDESF